MSNIGDRVKKYRLEKGLSLSEASERAGVAKSYLSSLERSLQTNPSIDLVQKIAEVLDVSLETLIIEQKSDNDKPLDPDWLKLAQEAMDSGISKQQLRDYIEFTRWKNENDH